jgi:hypothetical protein
MKHQGQRHPDQKSLFIRFVQQGCLRQLWRDLGFIEKRGLGGRARGHFKETKLIKRVPATGPVS